MENPCIGSTKVPTVGSGYCADLDPPPKLRVFDECLLHNWVARTRWMRRMGEGLLEDAEETVLLDPRGTEYVQGSGSRSRALVGMHESPAAQQQLVINEVVLRKLAKKTRCALSFVRTPGESLNP